MFNDQIPQSSSDDSIRAAILVALKNDVRTAKAELRVGVLYGVAHLAGSVEDLATRSAVEELTWCIEGVRGVANRIEAPGAPSSAREITLDLINHKQNS